MKPVNSILGAIVFLFSGHLTGQTHQVPTGDTRGLNLTGRHTIGISVGYMANSGNVSRFSSGNWIDVEVSSHALGWIGYGHWLNEEWGIRVEAGGMGAYLDMAAGIGDLSTEESTIVPFLFGVRYQPVLEASSTVRPFLAVLAGPYVEFSSRSGTRPFRWETGTRTTAGTRLGIGMDVLATRRFMMTSELRYHLLGDFEWNGDRQENYSGLEFALGLGVLLGQPR